MCRCSSKEKLKSVKKYNLSSFPMFPKFRVLGRRLSLWSIYHASMRTQVWFAVPEKTLGMACIFNCSDGRWRQKDPWSLLVKLPGRNCEKPKKLGRISKRTGHTHILSLTHTAIISTENSSTKSYPGSSPFPWFLSVLRALCFLQVLTSKPQPVSTILSTYF